MSSTSQPFSYEPSRVLPTVFAGIFLSSFFLHLFQAGKTRTWFWIPFLLGVLLETMGFILKAGVAWAYPAWNMEIFMLSFILPFVAPTLITASLFMYLGRVVRMCNAERYCIIPVSWMSKIFVAGVILALAAQMIGGIFISNPSSDASRLALAQLVNTAGLAAQIALLTLYFLAAVVFHRRYAAVFRAQAVEERLPWHRHVKALYFGLLAILTRSLVLLLTYAAPATAATLAGAEWSVYALDALPVCLAVLTFNWVHPSEVDALRGRGRGGVVCTRLFVFERPGLAPSGGYPGPYGGGKGDGDEEEQQRLTMYSSSRASILSSTSLTSFSSPPQKSVLMVEKPLPDIQPQAAKIYYSGPTTLYTPYRSEDYRPVSPYVYHPEVKVTEYI